eukprot:6703-Heterococcus_DN1.PRE.5
MAAALLSVCAGVSKEVLVNRPELHTRGTRRYRNKASIASDSIWMYKFANIIGCWVDFNDL